jgi:hypothetical protein
MKRQYDETEKELAYKKQIKVNQISTFNNLTNSTIKVFLEKLIVAQLVKKFPDLMEPCSQKLGATDPYPEMCSINPVQLSHLILSTLILSSHLHTTQPSCICPYVSWTENLCAFIVCFMPATCPAQLSFLADYTECAEKEILSFQGTTTMRVKIILENII